MPEREKPLSLSNLERLVLEADRGYHNTYFEQALRAADSLRRETMMAHQALRLSEAFSRPDGVLAEQARRTAEEFRRHDHVLAEQMRGLIEGFRRDDSLLAGQARKMAEDFRRYDSAVVEQAKRLMEDFRRHDSMLALQVRDAVDSIHLQQQLVSEKARKMFDEHRALDVIARASLARQISLEHQANRHALRSISFVGNQARDWSTLAEHAMGDLGSAHRLSAEILARAHATWATGIDSVLKVTTELGFWATNPALGARIVSLPTAYSSFCDSAIRELGCANDPYTANALKGSINLAGQHLARALESIPFLAKPPVEIQPAGPPKPMRLYVVQRAELLRSPEIKDPEDLAEVGGMSPAASAATGVLTVLRLIPQVNFAARLSGRDDVFKPTTRMLEAALDLIALVPANKAAFSDFVDCLYWLFYEGAGRDNLRYLSKQGGPLDVDDCEVIWAIKTLRNKWCRHDPDHGDPAHISRSYRTLREALQRFGLGHPPRTAEDHRRIQVLLITELLQFLEKLRDRLV